MKSTHTLFGESIRRRPTQDDDAVLDDAVDRLVRLLQRNLPREFDDDTPELRSDLREAISESDDGYKRAQYLDRHCGWDCDSALVELLNIDVIYDAYLKAVEEWVSTEGIVPTHAVGDVVWVLLTDTEASTWGGGQRPNVQRPGGAYALTITDIHRQIASYTLSSPELGHVPKGQTGTQGIILPYERVERS